MKNPFYNLIENEFQPYFENKVRDEIRIKIVKKVKAQLNRKKLSMVRPCFVTGYSSNAIDNFIVQCLMLSKLENLYSPPFNNLHSFKPNYKETGLKEWVNMNIPNPEILYPFLDTREFAYHKKFLSLFIEFGYGPNIEWYKTSPPFELANTPTNLYFIEINLSSIDKSKGIIFKVGITKRSIEERFRGYSKYIRILRFIEYSDGRDAWLREQKVINYDRHRRFGNNDYAKEIVKKGKSIKSMENSELGDTKLLKDIVSRLGQSEWVCKGFIESEALDLFDQLCDYPPYFS